jgi:dolichol-phosphate mannosyltransferase
LGKVDDRSVVVVVPTYNERDNLETLAERVLALGDAYRLIVVDDGSPDGTGAIADDLARRHPGRVEVMHRCRKQGLGPAYVAGLGAALATGAGIIVHMDADLSHNPDDVPRLVAAVEGADLAIGSRYVPGGATVGWPIARKALSRLGGSYARLVLGAPVHDLTGGFKAWRRETLAALDLPTLRADGYGFMIETTWRALQRGARVVELPIVFTDRVAGASKLSRRIVLEAAILVWQLRFEASRRNGAA